MKRLLSVLIASLYSMSTLVGFSILAPVAVRAESKEQTVKVAPVKTSSLSTEQTYNFVAQPGDSYSKISRKSIQIYGIKNKVNLSRAKIIAAETWLTQDASSPSLIKGQKVTVKESDVKKVVEKASKISKSTESAWAKYTVGVNFNTDNVGE